MQAGVVAVPISGEQPNYQPPAVIYEAALEVRAGSPLAMPDPLSAFRED